MSTTDSLVNHTSDTNDTSGSGTSDVLQEIEKAFWWQTTFNLVQHTQYIIEVFDHVDPTLHERFEKTFSCFLSKLPKDIQQSLKMYALIKKGIVPSEVTNFEYEIFKINKVNFVV